MGFGDDDYRMRQGGTNWQKVLMPVMGLLLFGCAAAIGFALSEPATDFVRSNVGNIPPGPEIQAAVGFGIFLILLLIFGAVYALFAPKPDKIISESELAKEKKARERERLAQRRRRREINQQMARERREREN